MIRAYRALRTGLVTILGSLALLLMFPLGLIRIYRKLRAIVRKAIKPLMLVLNARRFKQSEEEIAYFATQRQILIEAEQRERRRQVKLQMKRNQIASW